MSELLKIEELKGVKTEWIKIMGSHDVVWNLRKVWQKLQWKGIWELDVEKQDLYYQLYQNLIKALEALIAPPNYKEWIEKLKKEQKLENTNAKALIGSGLKQKLLMLYN